jgi:queuine tRNA-ribosyltransferase
MRNLEHARDERPLDSTCTCYACQHFSRAYLRHLVKAKEILAHMLLTLHNIHYLIRHTRAMRAALLNGDDLQDYRAAFLQSYRQAVVDQ